MRMQMEIVTLSPIFFGDGNVIGKKDYLYDRKANKIYIPNMRKMFDGLVRSGKINAFEQYLMNSYKELADFFRENGIRKEEYMKWMSYSVPLSAEITTTKEIHTMTKTQDGYPYIPGSALKGAFRTMITAYELQKKPELKKTLEARIKNAQGGKRGSYLKKEGDLLEKSLMYDKNHKIFEGSDPYHMVNNMMRGFRVSDSELLTKNDFCICQKYEYHTNTAVKDMPFLMECIKPGTKITFTVEIDKEICPVKLMSSIKWFFDNYKNKFVMKFKDVPTVPEKKYTMILGGNTGYATKTLSYSAFEGKDAVKTVSNIIDNGLPYRLRREHNHKDDVKKGVSPHTLKCTRYGEKRELMQMGACYIKRTRNLEE